MVPHLQSPLPGSPRARAPAWLGLAFSKPQLLSDWDCTPSPPPKHQGLKCGDLGGPAFTLLENSCSDQGPGWRVGSLWDVSLSWALPLCPQGQLGCWALRPRCQHPWPDFLLPDRGTPVPAQLTHRLSRQPTEWWRRCLDPSLFSSFTWGPGSGWRLHVGGGVRGESHGQLSPLMSPTPGTPQVPHRLPLFPSGLPLPDQDVAPQHL